MKFEIKKIVFVSLILLSLSAVLASGCLDPDSSNISNMPPEVIYSDYTYAELHNKSDLVVSGVVIHVTDPEPMNFQKSENRFSSLFSKEEEIQEPIYEELMETGFSYSDVTLLINDYFRGKKTSDFVTIRIINNQPNESDYHWGDSGIFFLSKNENPNEKETSEPDYYLVVTPRGENRFVERIDYEDGIASYLNGMNETVTYSELIKNRVSTGAVKGVYEYKSPTYDRIDPTKYGLNPLNKRIAGFYSDRENLTFEFQYVDTETSKSGTLNSDNTVVADLMPEILAANEISYGLIVDSDLVFYGTVVKEADCFSVYPTRNENISITGAEIVFRIDNLVKGNSSGNIPIMVYSGDFDGSTLILKRSIIEPIAWDFKEGEQYLIYLSESYTYSGYLEPMFCGIFPVIPD